MESMNVYKSMDNQFTSMSHKQVEQVELTFEDQVMKR